MQDQLFAEYPEKQRKALLEDNADAIEDFSYVKKFTHEELTEFKDQLSTAAVEIDAIEVEKKNKMEEINSRLKPIKTEHSDLLRKIRNKAESVTEKCFKMIERESNQVGFYNSKGELVYSRPILPAERQATIFEINPTKEAANG